MGQTLRLLNLQATNAATFDNVNTNGNTPQELQALQNITALGRSFGYAVALSSDDPANVLPTFSLAFNCTAKTQQLSTTETSPTYTLPDDSLIIFLNAETEAADGGSVTLQARITKPDGTLSSWGALDSFSGQKAKAIQFQAAYKSTNPGVSIARVIKASVVYADSSTTTSGGNAQGEIITFTQDWYMPVKSCRLTVRHSELDTSTITAAIALRNSPKQIKGEQLGVGSGGKKTYQLANTQGLKYDTLKLYYDGMRVYGEYEFNCEAGRITCTAPEGVIVTCDYDYQWGLEEWQEMTLSGRNNFGDYEESEFRFTGSDEGKSVCALKIVLGMSSGRISNELLGTATGKAKSFRLKRKVKDGAITLTSNGATLAAKYWSLSENGEYVSVAATSGQLIRASYDWVSETPSVMQFRAVYS